MSKYIALLVLAFFIFFSPGIAAYATNQPADLNGDGQVDQDDLNFLKTDFLKAVSAAANLTTDINNDGTITIKDAGIMMSGWGIVTPTAQFDLENSQGNENLAHPTIKVQLDYATSRPVTVQYELSSNYANSVDEGTGKDYDDNAETLEFAPGETEKTITLSIVDDEINEVDEPLIVTLKNPTGRHWAQRKATLILFWTMIALTS
jgi:hypothetical protein